VPAATARRCAEIGEELVPRDDVAASQMFGMPCLAGQARNRVAG